MSISCTVISQTHVKLCVAPWPEHRLCAYAQQCDRRRKSVLGTWDDAGADNPTFTFKQSVWQSLSNRLLNQRSGRPAFSSPLLTAMILRRALNWKLLHIKPSAQKPGSNWINILPSTINQLLSLHHLSILLCFLVWLQATVQLQHI